MSSSFSDSLTMLAQRHALPDFTLTRFSSTEINRLTGKADTRFPLASVTKTFTSHLCLEPELRPFLDVPLCETIPFFKLQDPRASAEMTPRDALCHFSGLAPHTTDWVRCTLSRAEYVRERLPRMPAEGPFREKHRYSNLMYAVLGVWIEQTTGISWEQQLEERILKPLKLDRTEVLDESWKGKVPPPHRRTESGILEEIPPFFARRGHLIAPASEMLGSMGDLARWGQVLLELDPQDERWRPHNRVTPKPSFPEFGPLDYGLGWRLDTVRGEPRYWHSGQCSGYTTLLTLYPERKTGMAAAVSRSEAVDALLKADLLLHT